MVEYLLDVPQVSLDHPGAWILLADGQTEVGDGYGGAVDIDDTGPRDGNPDLRLPHAGRLGGVTRQGAEGVENPYPEGMRSSTMCGLAAVGETDRPVPDSEGVPHMRTSDGTEPIPASPTAWSTAVPVDDYRTMETPAVASYRDRIIAVGRSGATRP
ncbi:hypothetical protein [Actinokineospora sp. NBRC 105648]|uniref:hypothetical protein n=1 Tax=Actinokineospora sp. NBRC 105648 TaxID=3032206 RepID=UPI0024A3058B|nr:hypothetical protein [Actinokineospora sp. NBRC 105648]GLZ37940.1 hypothetical protein Acsp05_15640 [Actinokineospora sp. NBRC 105648]